MNNEELDRRVRKPNGRRAANTLNNISERAWDHISLADAIEAATWAANERDRIQRQTTARFMNLAIASLKPVR